jgi:histidine triad (HIT) family protein
MGDCLFCKIARKEIPATIVHEDAHCLAFADINPQAPTHVLIVPRQHLADQRALADAPAELMGHLYAAANRVAAAQGLQSFRTVVNTGAGAGQSVFHLHLHLLGGRPMHWPPG